MRTKKGEKERLRLVILDKAIAYFKRHGRVGSGTEYVMRAMGLTRGALYSHFKSKDDLFAHAICRDLENLESAIAQRLRERGAAALASLIAEHLSERSLHDVAGGCVFTSLGSDMQRSKASHRAMYEERIDRLYELFATALRVHFPDADDLDLKNKALNLYSSLVGTLAMARSVKDPTRAKEILDAGRSLLISSYTKGRM